MTDEERKAKRREYYWAHRDQCLAAQAKYRAAHREQVNFYHKKYNATHDLTDEQKEKRREYFRKYAKEHRDYFNAKAREYRRRND